MSCAGSLTRGVGGFLQRPADQFPATFGGTVFETFPFLLPMLVAASLTCTGGVLGFFYIPETASQWRRMEAKVGGATNRQPFGVNNHCPVSQTIIGGDVP